MTDSIQWHHQMIASYIGVLVRDRREKKGMTVVELADACQYSNVSIYEIERGERLIPLHRLWILADVLGYPPESFLPPATKNKKDLRKKSK